MTNRDHAFQAIFRTIVSVGMAMLATDAKSALILVSLIGGAVGAALDAMLCVASITNTDPKKAP